jgi:hypothetical protein
MSGGVNTSETGDELGDAVSVSELHADIAMTKEAAQAASATEVDTREEFTGATLQPSPGPGEAAAGLRRV